MEDDRLEELKKLSPSQRIAELRKMKEEQKVEMSEVENLIRESESELEDSGEFEEDEPQDDASLEELFEGQDESLDQAVREEVSEEFGSVGYLAMEQAANDYTALVELETASMNGDLSADDMARVDEIGERLNRSRYFTASEKLANMAVASKAVLYKIKKYAGTEAPSR